MPQVSNFVQACSFAGAALVLLGFGGAQFGWLDARRPVYNLVNAAGSLVLGIIALHPFQLGFVTLEFAWVAISLYGLVRAMRHNPAA